MRAKDFIKKHHNYIAWELSNSSRNKILELFPPKYPDVICHHITYRFGVEKTMPLPNANNIRIIGYCDSFDGIECLVVEVDNTIIRPDNKIFHITLSLDRSAGKKPVDSNKAIEMYGFNKLEKPVNIIATAKMF